MPHHSVTERMGNKNISKRENSNKTNNTDRTDRTLPKTSAECTFPSTCETFKKMVLILWNEVGFNTFLKKILIGSSV